MTRIVGAFSLALALLGACHGQAQAVSFSMSTQGSPDVPNVINMYLLPGGVTTFSTTTPPTFLFNQPNATFTYYVSPDGYFAQLSTMSDYNTFTQPFLWIQTFDQSVANTPFALDWQEVQYTYAVGGGGSVDDGQPYSRTFLTTFGPAPPVGASNLPLAGPVPEPSLMLLFAMGAAGLAVRHRRKYCQA